MTYLEKLINDWPFTDSSLDMLRQTNVHEEKASRGETITRHSDHSDIAITYATLKHFGFDSFSGSMTRIFSQASREMVNHHWGDWWKAENVKQWCADQGIEEIDSLIMSSKYVYMDPIYSGEVTLDRCTLTSGMLCSVFVEDYKSLARVCDWYSARVGVDPQFTEEEVEVEYKLGVLCMASRFRRTPIEGIEEIVGRIESCADERPRCLLDLIDAAFEGKQHEFEMSLKRSLDLHHHRLDPFTITDLVGIEQSILAEIGRQNGLTIPDLNDRQMHTLLTPTSIGLAL